MKPSGKQENTEDDDSDNAPDSGGRGDTWGPHTPSHDRYPDEWNGGYLA